MGSKNSPGKRAAVEQLPRRLAALLPADVDTTT
jgi:hypothetical protein